MCPPLLAPSDSVGAGGGVGCDVQHVVPAAAGGGLVTRDIRVVGFALVRYSMWGEFERYAVRVITARQFIDRKTATPYEEHEHRIDGKTCNDFFDN